MEAESGQGWGGPGVAPKSTARILYLGFDVLRLPEFVINMPGYYFFMLADNE